MNQLTKNYRKIKSKKSWNKVVYGSQTEEDIIQIVLNYYMDYWQDIVRDFKLKKYTDVRDMLHYALEKYLTEAEKPGPHFIRKAYRDYLYAVHEEIKSHYMDLWEDYWANPEYQKALAEAHRWIKGLKGAGPKPPLTPRDLQVCLGACEAFMLVIE